MDTTERIAGRLPRFYRAWDKQSNFFRVIDSFAEMNDEQQKELFSIMRSHWVDTAYGIDLDYLGSIFKLKRRPYEVDDSFRKRIKFFIAEFTGGGTKESVVAQTVLYLDLKEDKPELIENPPVPQNLEKKVKYGDSWLMRSNSINHNEDARISLTLEQGQEGQLIDLLNPTLRDLDMKSSIKLDGILRSGQEIVIREDGTAELDGADITDKIIATNGGLKILRKGSKWIFEEDVSPNIGRFDESAFDERVYDMFVPSTHLRVEWTAKLLASFELKVKSIALENAGVSKDDLEEIVNAIKAIGVKAFVTVETAQDMTGGEIMLLKPLIDNPEEIMKSPGEDGVQTVMAAEQR
jgi:hypothetical protein